MINIHENMQQWSVLLGDDYVGDKMFDLQLEEDEEDDEEDEYRNVNFNNLYKRNFDELDTVSIVKNWHMLLRGEPGDEFAVFLQSKSCICQIVPIDLESCQSRIAAKAQAIAIPPEPLLEFDQEEGLGWRRFIVIRAKHLPLPPKSEATGHIVTGQELERFATLLLKEKEMKIAVDSYEFVLE